MFSLSLKSVCIAKPAGSIFDLIPKPSMEATCFRLGLTFFNCGAPCSARGSRMRVRSSFAGVRPCTLISGAGVRPDVDGAAAVRHMCSLLSARYDVLCFENNEVRPRFRLARIISSKSLMVGSLTDLCSRSPMNSLNACVSLNVVIYDPCSVGRLPTKASILKLNCCPVLFCACVVGIINRR